MNFHMALDSNWVLSCSVHKNNNGSIMAKFANGQSVSYSRFDLDTNEFLHTIPCNIEDDELEAFSKLVRLILK